MDDKPKHGEIRQTKFERLADSFLVEYTMYLDPREYYYTLQQAAHEREQRSAARLPTGQIPQRP